ncbi:UNC-like C-terminal-domain-containing protein [Podospora australis]|uniref:UNC-like C-terminal-domain-containing protein n=1 Tax=Podospora australis TaxID=1536484 RepID=A0AAN6WV49_9PEZI|nr:UNC-like C-terminal-domain-containing protein [Podospora australis]
MLLGNEIRTALALAWLGLHAKTAHGFDTNATVTPPTTTTTTTTVTSTATAVPSVVVGDGIGLAPPDTCEFRTINYITHTLPQQCLRTAWTSPTPAATAADVSASPSDVPAASTTASEKASTATMETGTRQEAEQPHTDVQAGEEEDPVASSFMSFEEWKEMMLAKSGQDAANVKKEIKQQQQQQHQQQHNKGEKEQGANHGNLEDEVEIPDYDALADKVSEITNSSPSDVNSQTTAEVKEEEILNSDEGKAQYYRSKDAGKTCKERFSYSSFDAGATVLKASPGAKNTKAILVENKDSYMLLECRKKNKFVIVELSDDILVDTVVLANFEFFSSMIRKFRVSASDRYPVKLEKWVDLGTFEARNSRDIQAFLVEHPQIYTKYIRIEFLTHYGNEYYCPVSLLRVHGTRMLDTWKEPREDDEPEQIEGSTQEAVQESEEKVEPPSEPTPAEPTVSTKTEEAIPELPTELGFSPWQPIPFLFDETCAAHSTTTAEPTPASPNVVDNGNKPAGQTDAPTAQPLPAKGAKETPKSDGSSSSPSPADPTSAAQGQSTSHPPSSTPAAQPDVDTNSTSHSHAQKPPPARSDPPYEPSSSPPSAKPTGTPTATRNKTTTSSTAASALPTVQESFFKTVTKRLQHLESNTSLSLQYIEEQSRFLRDVLQKIERKQVTRVDSFLTSLNDTVLSELRNVRTQYDQIWQSTVIALETQRDQSQREIVALTTRLNVLADEVVFQKRMAIFQSILLLSCLVLVIFSSRGGGLTLPDASSFPVPPGNSAAAAYYRRYVRSESGLSSAASPPPPTPGLPANMNFSPSPSSSATLAASALPRHLYNSASSPLAASSSSSSSSKLVKRASSSNTNSSAAYDKSLPLTPEYSRENTPSIHVSGVASSPDLTLYNDDEDDDAENDAELESDGTPVRRNGGGGGGSHGYRSHHHHHHRHQQQQHKQQQRDSLDRADPTAEISSIETGDGEGTPESGDSIRIKEEEADNDHDTRSGLSQLGGVRKPLPALPEDPSQ